MRHLTPFLLLNLLIFTSLHSHETAKEEKEKPPPIGNFSLPTSQQPAALFGFGGNIIDSGETQLYCFADDFIGKRKRVTDIIPSILFGVSNDFTILLNVPFTPDLQDGNNRSKGLEDVFVQLEYAFYNKTTTTYADQATVVFNMTAPTGSIRKNPQTGFGAISEFIGGTFYRTFVDYMFFTSHGIILPQSHHGTKFGDQLLYEFGVEQYLPSPQGWIYAWMLELDGQWNQKNRFQNRVDPNSGGNVIYLTPSIWISSKYFLLQFGVSLPVLQQLSGIQRKVDYAFNLNFAFSFY
jgi:hypothetical protein